MMDLTDILARIRDLVDRAEIAPGTYCRYADELDKGVDPYGCADAANILYTLCDFPRDAERREAHVAALRALQAEDGLFYEDTHHPIHCTAHCIAALELFDAGPARAPALLEPMRDSAEMERFLDALPWRDDPWRGSHRGAGLHAALTLTGQVTPEWRLRYAAWLAAHVDPATGLWAAGRIGPVAHNEVETLFPHMAGTFHYLFALESDRAPHPAPEALIDTCLALRREGAFPLGKRIGFAEIDWVYCLNRAGRQTPHRWDERQASLVEFAEAFIGWLDSPVSALDPCFTDLHMMFGTLCALAELQAALPGSIAAPVSLRLVLDRRPFI